MKNKYEYNKNLEVLSETCKLLTDKRKLRMIKIGAHTTRCFVIKSEGERWMQLEKVAAAMCKRIEKLHRDFDLMALEIDDLRNWS